MTAEELIETENRLIKHWEDGEISSLTHFMSENEGILVEIFKEIKPTDWVFASHRCHYHFLLHHANTEFYDYDLSAPERASLGRNCTHGVADELVHRVLDGKSMFLYGKRFLCSAIVAGTASIAAGMALSIQRRSGSEWVWCFLGDGAEDEGNFYEAVRLVTGRNLPCTFIIEDNGTSCGVSKAARGSPEGWIWPECVRRYHYTSIYPHAGTNKRPQLKWKP